MDLINILSNEFDIKQINVEKTIELIDEGNTIPFIARYRKEMTGEINDQVLAELFKRLVYLRALAQRKSEVEKAIIEQEKMTPQILNGLEKAVTLQEIEDIYRPFKPKRRTKAGIAKEKGLEVLAHILFLQKDQSISIEELAKGYLNHEKSVGTIDDALNGAMDIMAEWISDEPEYRKEIRRRFFSKGNIVTKGRDIQDSVYDMYDDFREKITKIAAHRVLAIVRGVKEGALSLRLETDEEADIAYIIKKVIRFPSKASGKYIGTAAKDAYKRLILPSIETEVINELVENASIKAIKVFAENLKNVLLQPPIKGRVVLGFDPAYRTGCKLAVVDDTGKMLHTAVIYPTPPQNKTEEAKRVLKDIIKKYRVDIISIGNGTASRESEIFVSELIKEADREIQYTVVNEAGASVYSASKLAAEEFPDLDVSLRSAVSIARRLQDPLAELVKIDPKSIGVGQYQHDMNQKKLGEALTFVVEACVNSIGVDLNTASPSLLSYVSGIGPGMAQSIIEYREKNGKFKERNELLKVKKLGEKTFLQCAGFLRIPESKNVFDNTSVHPESYEIAKKLLLLTDHSIEDIKTKKLGDLENELRDKKLEIIAEKIGSGIPTLKDIVKELSKPGRDPRDEIPKVLLSNEIIELKDLKPGMVITGTIRNVADFGAFVDIGVHQDGLVHISQLCDRFIKNPMDIVSVGDIVQVRVLDVDIKRKRISLSMRKESGTA